MKKRIISFLTAFVMVAAVFTGIPVKADAAVNEGGLLWNYRDVSNSAMTGVTSPAMDEDGQYIYMASAKLFYKIHAKTGKVAGTVNLSGSVGYNKIAPVVYADKAFIPLGAGKLDIVDTKSMKLIKTIQFADVESHKGHQTLTPAVYDKDTNAVYLGTWRRGYGGVYAKVSLNDYTSTVITESETGFYWAGACAEGDYVVFGSTSNGTDDLNTPSDGNATLYAYNKDDGSLLETVLKDSGSVCTTVVCDGDKYYFVSKSGKLYEASVANGQLKAAVKTKLAGKSTCTPVIKEGKAYIGYSAGVQIVDLATGAVTANYSAPADVKGLAVTGDKIYCTYNSEPGGLYDAAEGRNYFIPAENMQNYCISTIEVGSDGTLYYTNDSNNLMAVCDADKIPAPKVAAQKSVTAKLCGANDFKISWSTQKINGHTVKDKIQYQKKGGSWVTYKKAATGSSCIKNNLANGVQYRFKVTPYVTFNGKNISGNAKTTGYFYTLKAPKQPSVKRDSATKATLKWNKVKGATSYKIYRAGKKNGKYTCVKTVGSKYLSAKITAKKGKGYYYKVRACKGTVMGQFSTAKYYKFK